MASCGNLYLVGVFLTLSLIVVGCGMQRGEIMNNVLLNSLTRRTFIERTLKGCALVSIPSVFTFAGKKLFANEGEPMIDVQSVIREETLFAGIRKPVKTRAELEPRIELLKKTCRDSIAGPMTHIFRFDTPVDGYDSEIGFPVSKPVNTADVKTHTLRKMHFFSAIHEGPIKTLGATTGKIYEYMNQRGLSPELELVEIYHHYDPENPEKMKIENMASYLDWPGVYQSQLKRVLGDEKTARIWHGGNSITPRTLVDDRCDWVAESINRLKKESTDEQQFDILSRVALIRPQEENRKYKQIYQETKDITAVFNAQNEQLKNTRTGGFVDPCRYDGKILHISKVPYNRKAYDEAKTPEETRKAFCFCSLVREAKDPKIDPVFCYRAAGWSRQFWEPILGIQFKKCTITHSILKGDPFCAWDYHIT